MPHTQQCLLKRKCCVSSNGPKHRQLCGFQLLLSVDLIGGLEHYSVTEVPVSLKHECSYFFCTSFIFSPSSNVLPHLIFFSFFFFYAFCLCLSQTRGNNKAGEYPLNDWNVMLDIKSECVCRCVFNARTCVHLFQFLVTF